MVPPLSPAEHRPYIPRLLEDFRRTSYAFDQPCHALVIEEEGARRIDRAPSYIFRLSGSGVRAGYTVPIPRVRTVGGIPVSQAGQDVSQEMLCLVGGVPIYRSTWTIRYILPDDPKGGLPLPETPIAG